jgi:hypothetical protein
MSERLEKERFERDGWTVYKNGWPDFLMTKQVDGKTVVRAVELKGHYSDGLQKIAPSQERMFAALKELLGIEVEVLYKRLSG